MSTSSASGSTATVAAEVWMRPCASVAGTRCTRCTPLSRRSRPNAASPFDLEDRFLDPAQRALGALQQLDLPALPLGVARVHAHEVGGEECGFVAAGAGADLEDGGAVVERIARHKERRQLRFDLGDLRGEAVVLGARFGGHVGVGGGEQLRQLRALALGAREAAGEFGYGGEAPVLPAEFGDPAGVAGPDRIRQLALDLIEARERLREEIAEAQLSLPYF